MNKKRLLLIASIFIGASNLSAQYLPVAINLSDPYKGLPYRPKVQKEFEWNLETESWDPTEFQQFSYNASGLINGIINIDSSTGNVVSRDSIVYNEQNFYVGSYTFEIPEGGSSMVLSEKNVQCIDAQQRLCGYSTYELNPETSQLELKSAIEVRYNSDAASNTDTISYLNYNPDKKTYEPYLTLVEEYNASHEKIASTTLFGNSGKLVPFSKSVYNGWYTPTTPKVVVEQTYMPGMWMDNRKLTTVKEGDLYIQTIDSLNGSTTSFRNVYNSDSTIYRYETLIGNQWLVLKSSVDAGKLSTEINNTYDAAGVLLYSVKTEKETGEFDANIRETTFEKEGSGDYVKVDEEKTVFNKNNDGYVFESISTFWTEEDGEIFQEKTELSDFIIITGVETSVYFSETFSAYPNPSTGIFEINNTAGKSFDTFTLYNGSGVKIEQGTLADRTVNISGQPAGLYLLHVSANGKTETIKILKQ